VPDFYFIAGDTAYPSSPILIKPYSNREAMNDAQKRDFNARLSGIGRQSLQLHMVEEGLWYRYRNYIYMVISVMLQLKRFITHFYFFISIDNVPYPFSNSLKKFLKLKLVFL
jgi:hypothetical protein